MGLSGGGLVALGPRTSFKTLKAPLPCRRRALASPGPRLVPCPCPAAGKPSVYFSFQLEGTQLGKGSSQHAIYNSEGEGASVSPGQRAPGPPRCKRGRFLAGFLLDGPSWSWGGVCAWDLSLHAVINSCCLTPEPIPVSFARSWLRSEWQRLEKSLRGLCGPAPATPLLSLISCSF